MTEPEKIALSPPAIVPQELLVWFSSAFPIGAFAYSQGLETAVADGLVSDRDALADWLDAALVHGPLRNDLIVLSNVMRASGPEHIRDIAELALALQLGSERRAEALALGGGFRAAVEAGWPDIPSAYEAAELAELVLPVAAGIAARARALPLQATLTAFANGAIANALSAAIRLSVIGQFDALRIQAGLSSCLGRICDLAAEARLDAIGSATLAADIVAMRHETQTVRLFRS